MGKIGKKYWTDTVLEGDEFGNMNEDGLLKFKYEFG